ncbi:MAG: glucose/arabinose dehydrogenase [Limisphaerales bacterium]
MCLSLTAFSQVSYYEIEDQPAPLVAEVVASGLDLPWELIWGPDDKLWFTERTGNIKKYDPQSGEVSTFHFVEDVFVSLDNSGLHAMQFHYDFENEPWVYLVYTFKDDSLRLSRMIYDSSNESLSGEEVLMQLAGEESHNGARLIFDQTDKLLFCTGDAFDPSLPQALDNPNGKILRMNPDGSVPDDNPIPGNLMYTIGHRNPQGLVQLPNGVIWSTEHGPAGDDELNRIERGRNYGWPNVSGACNDSLENIFCEANNVMEPAIAWSPTPAPCGLEYYNHPAIPQWRNCLLQVFLKRNGNPGQRIKVISLSEDGTEAGYVRDYLHEGPILPTDLGNLNQTGVFGRLRDVMAAPDGSVYICTSNQEFNGQYVVTEEDDRIIRIYNPLYSPSIVNQDVLLYPNPGDGSVLYLKFEESITGLIDLYIYDALGRAIDVIEADAGPFVQIDLKTLESGFYSLYFEHEGKKSAQMFVVRD